MRAGLIGLLLGVAAQAAPLPPDDRPLPIKVAPQYYPFHYRAQLLGSLERPVGDGITLAGTLHAARKDDRGRLEVDVRGDGRFRKITRRQLLSFGIKSTGKVTRTFTVKLEIAKNAEGEWVYRNLTQLRVRIGSEDFVIADANGNGVYNEPRVDGMTWAGETYLFPLPSPGERWCSRTQNLIGLTLGPRGEDPAVRGRPLGTTVEATLPILKGINVERVKIGLTPRPEDPRLSADLQKHCVYMAMNSVLTHPEQKGKPGYTEEGHKAGMRSILSSGTSPERIAAGMVGTYFHRQDVIRPNTIAFGVGYEGRYGGIDGRSAMEKAAPRHWPVLSPAPGQKDAGLRYLREAPDATPGDRSAGYPIAVYFGTRKLRLVEHSLRALAPAGTKIPPGAKIPGQRVECYVFDPKTGVESGMTGYQKCVAVIPKDPLKANTLYEATFRVDVDGKPWSRTWRFETSAPGVRGRFPGR